MSVEGLAPLDVRLSGAPVTGINPGWCGALASDTPFAAMALVEAGEAVWWGKAEVAASNVVALALYLHPLSYSVKSVQFLFHVGSGLVNELSASIPPEHLVVPSPTAFRFAAARISAFCTVASEPPAAFKLFFLARSNVSAGRTGVWRPHKRFHGVFPEHLEAALFGSRHGTYPRPAAA